MNEKITKKNIILFGAVFWALFLLVNGFCAERPQYDVLVLEAQKVLKDLGYDPDGLDGVLGVKTEAALRKYQKNNRIPITGRLDPRTIKIMRISREEGQEVLMIPLAPKPPKLPVPVK